MGYHNESNLAKSTPLEAEMGRRLWWALVIFDNRVCEMPNYKTATLAPTWTCTIPQNLNDFELLPETKHLPPVHATPTEAVFVVLRSELSDFVRHCAFHLDFVDPLLTTFAHAKNAAKGIGPLGHRELLDFQQRVEAKTLALCDPANPLHFMTIWTTRGYLARQLLLEHCSRQSKQQQQQQQQQTQPDTTTTTTTPNPGITHALRMLECDTILLSSPLTRPYRWHIHFHFPFLAYLYIVQHLRKRPAMPAAADLTERRQRQQHDRAAWEAMSDNFEAHPSMAATVYCESPFYMLFSRVVLQAWEVQAREWGGGEEVPRIVVSIRGKVEEMRREGGGDGEFGASGGHGGGVSSLDGPSSSGMMIPLLNGVGEQSFAAPVSGSYSDLLPGDGGMDFMDMDQLWPTMDWGLIKGR
jgi:hypothetical protein